MLNYQANVIDIEQLTQIAKALSHPKRLAILDLLIQGVQCNCEISAQLGLADNLISHHMRALLELGVVEGERDPEDARWIYYSVNAERLAEIRGALCGFLDETRIQPRQPACGPSGTGACNV